MTRHEMIEALAEAGWRADRKRAMGSDRTVPWLEAGDHAHKMWRSVAEAMLDESLRRVAKWCDDNVLATGGPLDAKRYAGYVTEPAYTEIDNGRHVGNGYAEFFREIVREGHAITKSCVRCEDIFTTENKRDKVCRRCMLGV
jgi:hypothetical protein